MSDTKKMMIRVPPHLKRKIAQAVKRAQRSMNDVVVAILAERYEAEFTPVGRTVTKPVGDSTNVLLELPVGLYEAIRFEADTNEDSMRNRIVKQLSEHFSVPFEATARWPKPAVRA